MSTPRHKLTPEMEERKWKPGQSGNPSGIRRPRLIPSEKLFDGTGVEFAVAIYRDPAYPIELRLEAAMRAAKFQVPALSASLTATVEAKQADGSQLSTEQRRKRINELLATAKLPLLAAPRASDWPVIEGVALQGTIDGS